MSEFRRSDSSSTECTFLRPLAYSCVLWGLSRNSPCPPPSSTSTSSSPPLALALFFLSFHSPILRHPFHSSPSPFSSLLSYPPSATPSCLNRLPTRLPRLPLGSGAYSLLISPIPRLVRPNPPATFARFVKKQCGRRIIGHNCLPQLSPGYGPMDSSYLDRYSAFALRSFVRNIPPM
jgi:hypothetical protein